MLTVVESPAIHHTTIHATDCAHIDHDTAKIDRISLEGSIVTEFNDFSELATIILGYNETNADYAGTPQEIKEIIVDEVTDRIDMVRPCATAYWDALDTYLGYSYDDYLDARF